MKSGVASLSGREKETLRLLLRGHDAKSIAREQGLSVHTVNERLRDARRKLSVSSSREAARVLAEHERSDPQTLGDNQIGVAAQGDGHQAGGAPAYGRKPGQLRSWLIGGAIVMSMIIAALLFSSSLGVADRTAPPAVNASAAPTARADAAVARSALAWVALVDAGGWQQSWQQSGTIFKSNVTGAGWAAVIDPVRKPLGAVTSRSLLTVTRQNALPGVPAGDYRIVDFRTRFATPKEWTERVVLAREGAEWKVIGYFIL